MTLLPLPHWEPTPTRCQQWTTPPGTPLPSPLPKLEPEGRKSKVPVALPSAANSQRGAEADRSGVQDDHIPLHYARRQ